ncbi:RNA-guided endonuclease InsQ/TnpB family protein [Oxynema aestuarii]|uniref:IS200/IS605 family element transposase accessory protein TnpB n=1 Tax=Oxynema aestuarii AP17 TaxID=2064643 RepID=A0A6H1TY61_9CYAN|nr:RNA-guided endonuclease TnpB family protein [Oxynema aestuarii]QIZ70703.1 IS200/IS605 family element transposase accessory protein TnpB [Oxynema aestuarii AP17]
MLLGFKTQLKVNLTQRQKLARHAGVARHAYNWGHGLCLGILSHNAACRPDEKIKFPTAIDLHKWLNKLVKPENLWYYEVSKCVPQYALRHLAQAWQDCFKKKKSRPKFKKKGRQDSFTLDGTIKILSENKIQVPVIGILKTYERLSGNYQPKNVTISREADRWFISFKIDVNVTPTEKKTDVVGIDLGIKALATLSTGVSIEGIKAYKKYSNKLARLQRQVSRKSLGSANRKKSQLQVQKLHRRIANLRKDTLHKLTLQSCKNHAVNVIENLNGSGMMANHKLAKSIADMGFYEFRRQMEYKSQIYGSQLIIVDRFYPSSKICSNCGSIKDSLLLSERLFGCDHCHLKIDRDLNAAKNLEKIGRATAKLTPVDKSEPTPLVEAGSKIDSNVLFIKLSDLMGKFG